MVRQLSKILFFSLIIVITGCVENSSKYQDLKAQYDSLALINQEKERDMHQTDSMVTSVLASFQEIQTIGGAINVNTRKGELSKDEKARISENISLLKNRLEASSSAIDELIGKLSSRQQENKLLHNTLSMLKKEIEARKELIGYNEELLSMMDKSLAKFNRKVEALDEVILSKEQLINEQDQRMNQVRYCIGTKADLQEMKILVHKDKISLEQGNPYYFEQSDRRQLLSIPLHSEKATLLTLHPSGSYDFSKDKTGALVLNIKDVNQFWKDVRTLVIQVE